MIPITANDDFDLFLGWFRLLLSQHNAKLLLRKCDNIRQGVVWCDVFRLKEIARLLLLCQLANSERFRFQRAFRIRSFFARLTQYC